MRFTGGVGLLAWWLGAQALAAGEKPDPAQAFGLHVLDDFTFKWRGTIPQFAPFAPGTDARWEPWAIVEGQASIPRQTGRVKLGLGVGRLGWRVDSTTTVEGTAARVKLRLGLDVGAGRLSLRLPDVMVTPRFEKGQLGFDWVVPVIEERF